MTERTDLELDLEDENSVVLMVMTNDPTEQKVDILEMIYQSIALGQLAYADLKDADTGEICPFLVGLEPVPGTTKFSVWPLAKLVNKESDIKNYLVPDGAGNYHESGNVTDLAVSGMPADIISQLVSQFRTDGEEEAGETEGNHEDQGTVH